MNSDSVRVVLVSPRNPLNIGAAARAMSNFGFFHLRLVNAYNVAYREARSAVNASHVLERAQVFEDLASAVADCSLVVGTTAAQHRELKHPVRRLEAAAREIRGGPAPVALLFGSEKFGLSNMDLSYCHFLLRIPSREEHASMNLGQAVAVTLYELIRGEAVAAPATCSRAASEDVERMGDRLRRILDLSGYPSTDSSELKTRGLLRRMDLSARDAEVWMGILRQILWKLEQRQE